MKIIKYGKGYPKTVECGNCHSTLEYNMTDITIHDRVPAGVNDKPGWIKYWKNDYIGCPVCCETVLVSTEPYLIFDEKQTW